jgi:septal ring factor EnvC (AmiA/AmiB activator)
MSKKENKAKKRLRSCKRELKLLTGLLEQQHKSHKRLEKRIRSLTKRIQRRDASIRELKQQLKSSKEIEPTPTIDVERICLRRNDRSLVLGQRRAWERHQYLRSQYEHHLDAGHEKPVARALADRDLREKYGVEEGYSSAELQDILT